MCHPYVCYPNTPTQYTPHMYARTYVEHDAGVVDEHVQPVVGGAVLVDEGPHRGQAAHVEGHELQLRGVDLGRRLQDLLHGLLRAAL